MTMPIEYDQKTLNAFVDGELSTVESAKLVHDLAKNQQLADKINQLMQLKLAVQTYAEDPPCHLPSMDELVATAEKRRSHNHQNILPAWLGSQSARIAASAMVAVVLGAIIYNFVWLDKSTPSNLVNQALSAHRQWLEQTEHNEPQNLHRLVAYHSRNTGIYIPDLTASKLRITMVAAFGHAGLQIGYKGTRGCHISLFLSPAESSRRKTLSESLIGNSRIYVWRENHYDYALAASGMDYNRLSLIANDIFKATQNMQPFDQRTKMAMILNRQQSQACTG